MSLRLLAADGTLAAWSPAAPPKAVLVVEAADAGPLSAARARAVFLERGGSGPREPGQHEQGGQRALHRTTTSTPEVAV